MKNQERPSLSTSIGSVQNEKIHSKFAWFETPTARIWRLLFSGRIFLWQGVGYGGDQKNNYSGSDTRRVFIEKLKIMIVGYH